MVKEIVRKTTHCLSLNLLTQVEAPCKGIISWKHYTKQSSSEFSSWSVNFNKAKDNTSLYVMYTGMMGAYTNLSGRWACLRISILFNHTQCSSPAPIASGSALWKSDTGGAGALSSSAISGECISLPRESTAVTVKQRMLVQRKLQDFIMETWPEWSSQRRFLCVLKSSVFESRAAFGLYYDLALTLSALIMEQANVVPGEKMSIHFNSYRNTSSDIYSLVILTNRLSFCYVKTDMKDGFLKKSLSFNTCFTCE